MYNKKIIQNRKSGQYNSFTDKKLKDHGYEIVIWCNGKVKSYQIKYILPTYGI